MTQTMRKWTLFLMYDVRGRFLLECRKNAMVAADLYLQKYTNFSHIFVYLNFLQNELALIVGTVGWE
jgi:hypothetical protein